VVCDTQVMSSAATAHAAALAASSSHLLGSCDATSSPLVTVDPASHFLVFLADIVNSDIASKVAVSLIVLCVALGSGVLPMRVIARAQHQEHQHHHGEAGGSRVHRFVHAMVKYGNSFSAGVFLAMGIVHLMPEASRAFSAVYGDHYVERFHPSELCVLIGYVLILALHRVVFPTPTCPHALEGDTHGHSHGDDAADHSHRHEDQDPLGHSHSQRYQQGRVSRGSSPPPTVPHEECQELLHVSSKLATMYGATERGVQASTSATATTRSTTRVVCCRSAKHCVDVAHGGGGGSLTGGGVSPLHPLSYPSSTQIVLKNSSFETPSNAAENDSVDNVSIRGVDHLLLDRSERIANAGVHSMGWTLVIALSVHAICEGLALGLQCGPQNVMMLGCAICSHKWAESFALSSSLIHQAVTPRHNHGGDEELRKELSEEEERAIQRAWKIVVLFALATPIGALIGGVMHSKLPPASAGVVKALSAGTFMYIGASEVVVEEFVQGRQYWGKWICLVGGVAVMYSLNMLFR
jgi:zinc transporter ZupT